MHHFSLIPNPAPLPEFLQFSDAYLTGEGATAVLEGARLGREEGGREVGRRKDK